MRPEQSRFAVQTNPTVADLLPTDSVARDDRLDFVPTDRWSFWQRRARQLLWRGFTGLRDGQLSLRDAQGEQTVGGESTHHWGPLQPVHIDVLDPRLYPALLTGGSLAASEGYIRGWWRTDDLPGALRLMLRNQHVTDDWDRDQAWWRRWAARTGHWLRRNTPRGSKQNIIAHYDLGNDFYALMLDASMAYSSGLFTTPDATLEAAQQAKFSRLCDLLELSADDHLLEIGTGWGGLAEYAAKRSGCRVTTTTISPAQHRAAVERIARAGLSDRVTVLQCDYRDLTGTFDKLVSVEMIEAVGHRFLPQYFAQCGRLLRPGGKFALQAITIEDQRYAGYLRSVDFIQQYVFPGGCLPSLTALCQAMTQASRLRAVRVDDFGLDYARTLVEWRKRFFANLDEVRTLGYSEPFIRMWEYYLAYCEAGFRERATGLLQMLIQ